MEDLSDFKRGQTVGARVAGASITKTAELFSLARSSVWKVMIAFEIDGKDPSSSSYRAGSTDIPDPLSPLLPIVHRPRQVFRTTTCILT